MSGWVGLGALALIFVAGPVAELAFDAARLVDSDWLTGLGLVMSVLGPGGSALVAVVDGREPAHRRRSQ